MHVGASIPANQYCTLYSMYTDLFSEGVILKNHSSLTEVLQKYSTVRGP